MFKEIFRGSMFLIVKFLLVIIVFFFEKGRFKKLFRFIIFLSDMLFVYSCSIKVKNFFGEIFINVFKVVWCLYELNSLLFKRRLFGIL